MGKKKKPSDKSIHMYASGGSPGERNGHPLQYSFLENFMVRGAWQVCRVTMSWTGVPKICGHKTAR